MEYSYHITPVIVVFLNVLLWTPVETIVILPSTVDCNKKPIGVAPLGPVIVRSQINQRFDALTCRVTFSRHYGYKLCLFFSTFYIENCDVDFLVERGNITEKYDCYRQDIPETICTGSLYLTLVLKKTKFFQNGYKFELTVNSSAEVTSADFVKGMGAFNKSARPVVVAMVLIPTLFVILWNVYTHWRKCQHKRHNQPGKERDVQRHIVYVGGKFKKKPLTII